MKCRLLALITLLLVLSLACSALSLGGGDSGDSGPDTGMGEDIDDTQSDGGDDDVSDDDGGALPDTDDDAQSDGDGDAAFSFDSEGLAQLDSYRAAISYELTNDDGSMQTLSFEQAEVRDPPAQHLRIASAEGEIEYIQIGDQLWIRFGEEWIQSTADDADLGEDFGGMLSDPTDWLGDIEDGDYEYLGRETVNGVRARHYRAEYDAGWLALLDQSDVDVDADIDSGVADVWIADESDLPQFVVRYVIDLEGQIDGDDGAAILTQDVTDVNEDIVIQPPEGVESGGLPEGIPVYPEATSLTSFGGMTTFETTDDLEAVDSYYVDALEAEGWEEGEGGFATENMVSSAWSKDDVGLSLTISSDDDVVTVLIMVDGE